MPFDDPRVAIAMDVLAHPIAEFRAAIAGSLAHAEAVQAEAMTSSDARTDRARTELGVFAEGRINPAAFAHHFPRIGPASAEGRKALDRAVAVLRRVFDRGDRLFAIEVVTGGDLRAAIGAALAEVGRAFGAVQLAERVRSGGPPAGEPDPLLAVTEFQRWPQGLRRIAPPLIVSVEGADLHAAALADFCDGNVKLLMLVRGACAPAPLARLITPGTFVVQTGDRAGLDRFASYQGPAVAAWVPAGAARFLHDPEGGKEAWQRLSVLELPSPPRRGLGGASAWQMSEDLRQLAAMAQTPFTIPAPGAPATAAIGESDAVDRLTSWLLARESPSRP